MRLLILDNYDSFTYNLVQHCGELGADAVVRRNDELSAAEALESGSDAVIISPGPGTPALAGIAVPLIRLAAGSGVPLLGVCLGHQAIGEAFGGKVVRASRLMHGKTGEISHTGSGVFAGLPSPLRIMRYHSLIVAPDSLPPSLEVTAWSADRPAGQEIMGLAHRDRPIHGVQFHPESVATERGREVIANFLNLAPAFQLSH